MKRSIVNTLFYKGDEEFYIQLTLLLKRDFPEFYKIKKPFNLILRLVRILSIILFIFLTIFSISIFILILPDHFESDIFFKYKNINIMIFIHYLILLLILIISLYKIWENIGNLKRKVFYIN